MQCLLSEVKLTGFCSFVTNLALKVLEFRQITKTIFVGKNTTVPCEKKWASKREMMLKYNL
jgi:hypothetical protein